MNRLLKYIRKNTDGKNVLILFIITNIIYTIMLVVTIPNTIAYSGGMRLLDMMPLGYDFSYVNDLFNALGDKGRSIYLYQQLPIDMIYPFLFGMTYSFLFAYFLTKLNKLNSSFIYLCLLPIIGGLADYAENIGIITMLVSYPDISLITSLTTNVFSVIKSMTSTLFFIVLIVTIIIFGIKSIRRRRTTT